MHFNTAHTTECMWGVKQNIYKYENTVTVFKVPIPPLVEMNILKLNVSKGLETCISSYIKLEY